MPTDQPHDPGQLAAAFVEVRGLTTALAAPLGPEDQCIQSMPDASPTKWHLAHTSWFFETFVLAGPGVEGYRPGWDFLFNSYYQTVGTMHARAQRGLLSRPTVAEVRDYRAWIDERVLALLSGDRASAEQLARIELGLHHEQQHQELILTDIKHALGLNPLGPAYRSAPGPSSAPPHPAPALRWVEDPGGLVEIGQDLAAPGFRFDNEGPRHKQWLEPFAIASRPATCAEYLEFIEDGGYARPELWLAEGWDWIARTGCRAPGAWLAQDSDQPQREFTLDGVRELELGAPVSQLSYYEADAFARWAGARLPTEAEWERIAGAGPDPRPGPGPSPNDDAGVNLLPATAAGLDHAPLRPRPSLAAAGLDHAPLRPDPSLAAGCTQLFGDVWEWTASPYAPYPGYRPAPGAIGEYNGKFMCNQMVLRGGSCVTPATHVRATYRNFFPAATRWQFSGVRLAKLV